MQTLGGAGRFAKGLVLGAHTARTPSPDGRLMEMSKICQAAPRAPSAAARLLPKGRARLCGLEIPGVARAARRVPVLSVRVLRFSGWL